MTIMKCQCCKNIFCTNCIDTHGEKNKTTKYKVKTEFKKNMVLSKWHIFGNKQQILKVQ